MKESNFSQTWSLVVVTNDENTLRSNLLKPGPKDSAKEIVIQRNARSAASAYNEALERCTGDLAVFAHQDVYLPAGWSSALTKTVGQLEQMDSQWGVLGLFGITQSGSGVGHVYSTGLRRFVGQPFSNPIPARTIDEMLLIVRRDSGLHFDDKLPGFHLYGTDICLEAEARGMRNYVVPCFALHNSNGVKRLPRSFWQAYLYLRKKWKIRLPVVTPCTTITRNCRPMIEHMLQKYWSSMRGDAPPGQRVDDPERFYLKELFPVLERSLTDLHHTQDNLKA